MILHTFGDSHCRFPWEKVKIEGLTIKIHNFEAVTCASFGFNGFNVLNIKSKKWNVNDDENICFSFGEIDCRAHITKEENFKIHQDLINKIVFNYFAAIKINVEQFKNLKTMIFNVVPARNAPDDIIGILNENPKKYPYMGSNEERKMAVIYMNSKIKEYCEKNNYVFIDVYDKYCDKDGFLNAEFSDGMVHIKDPIYLTEFLNKNNVLK